MTESIRAELLKLRTIRLPLALLATAAALTALVTVLEASRAGGPGHMAIPPLDTEAGLTAVLTSTGFALLLAMVFGVIVASGEFRHGTATATYLATPHRARVLTAKALTAAAFGLLFGLVAAAIASGVGLGFVAARGYQMPVPGGTIARYAAGAVLASGLLAAAGVGLGSLVRSQVGAVITVFAWGLLVEQLVAGQFDGAAPYLPYTAATTLAGATLGGGVEPLPFAAAAALVATTATLVALVAARTTVRSDVS
jgi:ABC-2 type transport system permease protein